ncbi:alpha/beta fold hydrolase [Paenibacillus antarcticus]|uniref:Hydrolase n=1 Tax=Paenibacillus antarcticus TaxID=253703 RepID=A0A168JMZ7_9BACL|nr:alpha/beta hydrolase [Paenibacillus antarcticus]OAB40855.1 hydrolase [Paenibacillus antarcticus]OAB43809.1 hydrolase [Paenibacillus antarcticus]
MTLFVNESGNKMGPMLVFIHGAGVSGWMWDKQVEYFKEHYYVVVPDLPSHGKSHDKEFTTIHDAAQDIAEVIRDRDYGQSITIIGFSLGAQIALEMLSMNGIRMDRAIIISGLVTPMKFTRWITKPLVRIFMPLTKNRFFSRLQAKELYIGDEYFELYYQESALISMDSLLTILNENMSYCLPQGFNQGKTKVLVLVGAKEKKQILKSSNVISSSSEYCEREIVPNIGHGISLANPALFNHMIEAWIR